MRCLSTTGQADYILTVIVPDIAAYERFLHATLFRLPGIRLVRRPDMEWTPPMLQSYQFVNAVIECDRA